ncbi:hypothetical protein HU157_01740 [Metamycoplasma hominis]|uniref:hypothetical protein n=1 Tax=Metamycoplasma hominis TaxID=2098 RepID=UPI00158B7512|nr:hypothetical protein [Metamycoplasma hominis]QKX38941.1 hypothetical protein HU157_01740 [Metamycoplasma hominis]
MKKRTKIVTSLSLCLTTAISTIAIYSIIAVKKNIELDKSNKYSLFIQEKSRLQSLVANNQHKIPSSYLNSIQYFHNVTKTSKAIEIIDATSKIRSEIIDVNKKILAFDVEIKNQLSLFNEFNQIKQKLENDYLNRLYKIWRADAGEPNMIVDFGFSEEETHFQKYLETIKKYSWISKNSSSFEIKRAIFDLKNIENNIDYFLVKKEVEHLLEKIESTISIVETRLEKNKINKIFEDNEVKEILDLISQFKLDLQKQKDLYNSVENKTDNIKHETFKKIFSHYNKNNFFKIFDCIDQRVELYYDFMFFYSPLFFYEQTEEVKKVFQYPDKKDFEKEIILKYNQAKQDLTNFKSKINGNEKIAKKAFNKFNEYIRNLAISFEKELIQKKLLLLKNLLTKYDQKQDGKSQFITVEIKKAINDAESLLSYNDSQYSTRDKKSIWEFRTVKNNLQELIDKY